MQDKTYTIARDDKLDVFTDANGNIALVYGLDAYAQIINAKMRTILGEMQLSMQKGIPYFQTVFASAEFLPVWEAEVRKMLEGTSFVKNIKSFTCDLDGDVLQYTAEIETDKGIVTING